MCLCGVGSYQFSTMSSVTSDPSSRFAVVYPSSYTPKTGTHTQHTAHMCTLHEVDVRTLSHTITHHTQKVAHVLHCSHHLNVAVCLLCAACSALSVSLPACVSSGTVVATVTGPVAASALHYEWTMLQAQGGAGPNLQPIPLNTGMQHAATCRHTYMK